MKAIVHETYGPPEVLELRDIAKPLIGDDDVLFDLAGNRRVPQRRRVLTPLGRVVLVGGEGGGQWTGGVGESLMWLALSTFVRQKVRLLMAAIRKDDLQTLKALIETGKVTPVVDRTYPLRDVPEAIRSWERGHARGKVVITV